MDTASKVPVLSGLVLALHSRRVARTRGTPSHVRLAVGVVVLKQSPALAAQPLHRCICLRGPFRERSAFEERLGGFSSQGDIYPLGLFVGRTLKGVRELYELGGYIAQLGAHRIVGWARKPAVEPSRPIDSVGEFYQIAFAKDDLLSERSRLRQATFAVLYGWIVNGAVIVFHKHDCGADW